MHHCLNVVPEAAPRPAALLIRAVDSVGGPGEMRVARQAVRARGHHVPAPQVVETRHIGIVYAGESWTSLPWRFLVPGSRSVSRQA